MKTFGQTVHDRRTELGISLKDLGLAVCKEDQTTVSAQYLHDIEKDRRIPSEVVLSSLAEALGMNAVSLAAVAGRVPAEVVNFFRKYPEKAPEVVTFFAKANTYTVWK